MLNFKLKTQQLDQDDSGHSMWKTSENIANWPAEKTALLLCDVWDNHWCRGAVERLEVMLPRMNEVVKSARLQGVHIIHAPSNTLNFYADSPARKRMLDIPPVDVPEDLSHEDPPLPVDDSDGGSDTGEDPNKMDTRVWTRQHAGIEIDEGRDVISDQGKEVYAYMQHHNIDNMLIMGVHTNMCVLHRTFAIKQMVRWGKSVALIRDLTDAMYNPAKSPYVSHDAGTQLIIEFIEKFWCSTILSDDLIS
ncbi:MAG: nicotinamidase-related amidase [Candidatus Latescibacterota bacterium]|jgi:nicotinamidase-related amidase